MANPTFSCSMIYCCNRTFYAFTVFTDKLASFTLLSAGASESRTDVTSVLHLHLPTLVMLSPHLTPALMKPACLPIEE